LINTTLQSVTLSMHHARFQSFIGLPGILGKYNVM